MRPSGMRNECKQWESRRTNQLDIRRMRLERSEREVMNKICT